MNEIWRDVPGFGGYEVSDAGRIKSTKNSTHLILKQHIGNNGYMRVSLHNPKKHVRTVHSIVADAFLGIKQPGMQVRHLDGNGLNNCLLNLAYGTAMDNINDAVVHGTRGPGTCNVGEAQGCSKLTWAAVAQIRGMLNCKSNTEIATIFGVSRTTILYIRKGHTWKTIYAPASSAVAEVSR